MDTRMSPRMTDTTMPLYVMAFLLGHESEALRELGTAMLLMTASALAEHIQQMQHAQSCPRCQLRRKLIDTLMASGDTVTVPEPQEFV